jgi:hypothetical protein
VCFGRERRYEKRGNEREPFFGKLVDEMLAQAAAFNHPVDLEQLEVGLRKVTARIKIGDLLEIIHGRKDLRADER